MPINIHGKQYKTVAERLAEAHGKDDFLGCQTEVLAYEPRIMVKATITTKKGEFTGISAADPSKSVEKRTPVEVAETSAVGRALAFAGYAGSEIASAEEMRKAFDPRVSKEVRSTQYASDKQLAVINRALKAGKLDKEIAKEIPGMTKQRASELVGIVLGK